MESEGPQTTSDRSIASSALKILTRATSSCLLTQMKRMAMDHAMGFFGSSQSKIEASYRLVDFFVNSAFGRETNDQFNIRNSPWETQLSTPLLKGAPRSDKLPPGPENSFTGRPIGVVAANRFSPKVLRKTPPIPVFLPRRRRMNTTFLTLA